MLNIDHNIDKKGLTVMAFKKVLLITSCLLLLATPVFAAESLIKQESNVGRIDLKPENMINKTENQWRRQYWDGSNMVDVTYTATLNTAAKVTSNVDANNTHVGEGSSKQLTVLKSGYGYMLDITSNLTALKDKVGGPDANAAKELSSIQNMNVYFPEFEYANGISGNVYNRLGYKQALNENANVSSSTMYFRKNVFSGDEQRVHFTPFWLPDGLEYVPYVEVFDAWTPGGMLGTTLKPTFEIDSQVYDDWHIAPINAP